MEGGGRERRRTFERARVRVLEAEELAYHADVLSGMKLGAPLPDDDVSGNDGLASELLDAKKLRVRVSPVPRRSARLLRGPARFVSGDKNKKQRRKRKKCQSTWFARSFATPGRPRLDRGKSVTLDPPRASLRGHAALSRSLSLSLSLSSKEPTHPLAKEVKGPKPSSRRASPRRCGTAVTAALTTSAEDDVAKEDPNARLAACTPSPQSAPLARMAAILQLTSDALAKVAPVFSLADFN